MYGADGPDGFVCHRWGRHVDGTMRRLRSSSGVLDYNQDGLLSGEELRAWIQKEDDVMNDEEAEEEAKVALEVFDHDKDLSLNKAEFKEAINSREETPLSPMFHLTTGQETPG
ncbi:unnamed protein product [Durusdinium trenchii]|uniref:EF-hand domain-containing protein n=1 Tax=Durusdinium trenchii TaxID=1381693 RepID=A0ABP0SZL4_9DINO